MIRNIFFDIDDTLFPSSAFAELARRNAVKAIKRMAMSREPWAVGKKANAKELYKKLLKIIEKKGSNYQKHFDLLCKELKIKRPARYIAAAVAAYHNTKTRIRPYPEIKKTLALLRKHGYKLYVATNGNTIKQWDKLIRLGISDFFDDVFVSEEMGTEKNEKFFRRILKTLNTRPQNCLMVGDREDSDILPAKRCGMKTIRVLRGKYAKEGKSAANARIKNLRQLPTIIAKI